MKKMTCKFILSILGLIVLSATTSQAFSNELKFGSVAMDIPAIMHRKLTPLTAYLSQAINKPVSLQLSPNMASAINEVASNNVDLAYLTPVAYIKAHKKGNADILVKTVTNNKASFQLMIVVRKDSPIKTIADLEGAEFAFGDKAALLQRAVVVGAGIPLDKLGAYKFIGHYDNIARGVQVGDFDAGILKDTKAYKWESKGLRILYSSPALPPYNITVSSKLDKATRVKLKNAFLALDDSNPRHRAIIKSLSKKYNGFAPAKNADYDVVRTLIKPFN